MAGVRLLGHVDDRVHLAALLADADVVTSTATRAGAGLAALEAGALADGLAAVLRGDRQAQRHLARLRAEQFTWAAAAAARLDAYAALVGPRPSAA
jgi:hypothetical protein